MKSRTSFFNKTLYWKDITRFWPLWTIEMVLLLLAVLLPVFSGVNEYRSLGSHYSGVYSTLEGEIISLLEEYGPCLTNGFVLAGVALTVALFIFSYLFKARETYNAHCLPMKRETMFFSHYLAGLTILMVPFVAVYTILICVAASYKVGITLELLGQLVITLVGILFFFSLACLMIMLTANGIMAAVIYAVINVLYQAVAAMFVAMGGLCIFGYQGDDSMITSALGQCLTPVAFFSGESSIFRSLTRWSHDYLYYRYESSYMEYVGCGYNNGYLNAFWYGPEWNRAVWYLIPAVLFLGLAILLYRKRSLETAGNMLAFSWGKPVFRLVFTLTGSMAFSLLIYWICIGASGMQITYKAAFLFLLGLMSGGSLLGYLISNMILYKTFFIWKKTSYWRMLLLTGLIAGTFSYVKYGYGEKIPEAVSVDFVKMELPTGGDYGNNIFYIQGEQEIQKFQEIDEKIMETGENELIEEKRYHFVKDIVITYVMESGEQICREYAMDYDIWKRSGLVDFLNEEETMCEKVFSKAYQEVVPLSAKLTANDGTNLGYFEEYDILYQVYESALKDIEEGNMILEQRDSEFYYLDICVNLPKECMEKYGLTQQFISSFNKNERVIELPVSESCVNLMKIIEDDTLIQDFDWVDE